jgi:hypothetical protein
LRLEADEEPEKLISVLSISHQPLRSLMIEQDRMNLRPCAVLPDAAQEKECNPCKISLLFQQGCLEAKHKRHRKD